MGKCKGWGTAGAGVNYTLNHAVEATAMEHIPKFVWVALCGLAAAWSGGFLYIIFLASDTKIDTAMASIQIEHSRYVSALEEKYRAQELKIAAFEQAIETLQNETVTDDLLEQALAVAREVVTLSKDQQKITKKQTELWSSNSRNWDSYKPSIDPPAPSQPGPN